MPESDLSDRRAVVAWRNPTALYALHERMHSIDLFRAIIAGEAPYEPAMSLLGAELVAAEPGEVRMALVPAEHHYNQAGIVHPGILTAVADTTAGYAVHTRLPFGATAATLELHLGFPTPVTTVSGQLTCIGRATHVGARTAVADAQILDSEGILCATMGTTMLIKPPSNEQPSNKEQETRMPDNAAPERQLTITWSDLAILQDAEKRLPWIDILRQMVSGAMPVPPSFRLQGFIPVAVEPGEVTFALDPAEQHYNLISCVHGGILSALCDTSAGLAVHSRLPFGTTCTTLELHVNFIRPVSLASGRATCVGRVIHLGARTATAEARITDSQGRLCAHMGTTLLVLPIAREDQADRR